MRTTESARRTLSKIIKFVPELPLSPLTPLIASGGEDKRIVIWSILLDPLCSIIYHPAPIISLACVLYQNITPKNIYKKKDWGMRPSRLFSLFSVSRPNTLHRWDIGQPLNIYIGEEYEVDVKLMGSLGNAHCNNNSNQLSPPQITRLCVCRSDIIAAGDFAGVITLYQVDTLAFTDALCGGHTAQISALTAFIRPGCLVKGKGRGPEYMLVSAGHDGRVVVWDCNLGIKERVLSIPGGDTIHSSMILDLCILTGNADIPLSTTILGCSFSIQCAIVQWNGRTGRPMRVLKGGVGEKVLALNWGLYGHGLYVLGATYGGYIKAWDMLKGKSTQTGWKVGSEGKGVGGLIRLRAGAKKKSERGLPDVADAFAFWVEGDRLFYVADIWSKRWIKVMEGHTHSITTIIKLINT